MKIKIINDSAKNYFGEEFEILEWYILIGKTTGKTKFGTGYLITPVMGMKNQVNITLYLPGNEINIQISYLVRKYLVIGIIDGKVEIISEHFDLPDAAKLLSLDITTHSNVFIQKVSN